MVYGNQSMRKVQPSSPNKLGQYKGFIIWPKTFENFSLRDSTREIPSGQDIRATRVSSSGRRQRPFRIA